MIPETLLRSGKSGAGRLLALLLLVVLAAHPACAITAAPGTIELTVDPGTAVTVPLHVSLPPGETAVDLVTEVTGLGQAVADARFIPLPAEEDKSMYSARPFVTVDRPFLFLEPGSEAVVNATIAVPAGMKDGGRYAMIRIRPAGVNGTPAAGIPQEAAVAVLLTLRGGIEEETGEITALAFSETEDNAALSADTLLAGTGNHHCAGLVSSVTITDRTGSVLARSATAPLAVAVIPGQEILFHNTFDRGMPAGADRITVRVEKSDGTLLAEKTEPLGGEESPPALPEAPGFGAVPALAALAAGIPAIRRAGLR
jgi:hypothetical protein